MQTISHYVLLKKLGQGGMAEVFLAEDTRLKRKVALKFLSGEFTTDQSRLNRFQQEARAASSLNHPNILTVFDIGEADSTQFIATEYVEGVTLRRKISEGQIELTEVLDIAIQVAGALAAAHQAGIVHRDIKPENMMIRPDGLVKLLDFGIAKLSGQRSEAPDSNATTGVAVQTEPGLVMGSPRYMSPEQVRGLDVDARTDIFSLGVVLYEMATGRPPFQGATLTDSIVAVLHQEPGSLLLRCPGAPGGLEQAVTRALKKDPQQRYQRASDFLADLKHVKKELETQSQNITTRSFLGEPHTDESPTIAANAETVAVTRDAQSPGVGATRTVAVTSEHEVKQTSRSAPLSRKIWIGAFAILVIIAAAGIYLFIRPHGPNAPPGPDEKASIAALQNKFPAWIDQVFLSQDRGGGIRPRVLDLSMNPQVWVTAQFLNGVLATKGDLSGHVDQIKKAFAYIESLRHSGPEGGWNLYGDSNPYTITEVGAWVTLSEIASVESKTRIWNDSELAEVLNHIDRDLKYLADRQVTSGPEAGGWSPIKDQFPHFTRTYSTVMTLWALVEARRSAAMRGRLDPKYEFSTRDGIRWLLAHRQNSGWAPNPNHDNPDKYDAISAQALYVLSRAEDEFSFLKSDHAYLEAEKAFLSNNTLAGRRLEDNDHLMDADQYFPDTQFQAEGSTYLWFPWTVAELTHLSVAAEGSEERATSRKLRAQIVTQNAGRLDEVVNREFGYVLAENLYCLSTSFGQSLPDTP